MFVVRRYAQVGFPCDVLSDVGTVQRNVLQLYQPSNNLSVLARSAIVLLKRPRWARVTGVPGVLNAFTYALIGIIKE